MTSLSLVCLTILVCTTTTDVSAKDTTSLYQITGSCKANQLCTYKYTTKQEEFGKNHEKVISIGATVEVLCNSVGVYNGTGATEYCMQIEKIHLRGVMFSNKKQRRALENMENKNLVGWFCFVQTAEGKVVSVFHSRNENLEAVNFKKSIAAAFQANFKGTTQEEETDPQSKHISHYRYTQRQDGAQKMHRSIRSKDVEQYPGDSKPREISLRKEEDIEYQSGSLKSSSGTATVALAASKKQRLQMEMEEEEDDSFAVKGSYRLKRIHCYTLKHSEAWKRRRRSTGDAVEATLSATIDKRSIVTHYLEDLRNSIPSPLHTLIKLHQEPEKIHLASKLQQLLVLEAEHGPSPGTVPALTAVLYYLNKLNHSQDAEDAQIKQTIHSLLAHEGTLKSQMALLDALVNGTDAEQDSAIVHITLIKNAHTDFVKELERLLNEGMTKGDSLILAYSALATTTSSRVQQSIINFVKSRLMQHMEVNDTATTVHLIHALGNTGSKQVIGLLFDYFWHSNSVDVKLAAISAMRKLTANPIVQEAFINILKSTPEESFVEEIASTLLKGEDYLQLRGVYTKANTDLLNALVAACLQFSNSTQMHHLVYSYLDTVDTPKSHMFKKYLELRTGLRRVRRANWDASDSIYDLIAPHYSRENDILSYPTSKSFLWGRKLGPSDISVEVAAGAFAGGSQSRKKLFGKAIAKGNLFSRSSTIGEAMVLARADGSTISVKLYAEIGGNVLVNYNRKVQCCLSKTQPVDSIRYTIIRYQHSIFVYVGTINFYVELNAYLDVKLSGKFCLGHPVCGSGSNKGKISLTPTVRISPEGGAYLNILSATKIGISISASLYYELEPVVSAQICPSSHICRPPLKVCAELYHSFPANHVDIFAWYQLRSVEWESAIPSFSWGSKNRCCVSKRWDLSSASRSKIWGQCASN